MIRLAKNFFIFKTVYTMQIRSNLDEDKCVGYGKCLCPMNNIKFVDGKLEQNVIEKYLM